MKPNNEPSYGLTPFKNKVRTGQFEGKRIDSICKAENNANKALRQIAQDPSSLDEVEEAVPGAADADAAAAAAQAETIQTIQQGIVSLAEVLARLGL